jgi:hypothetical protein
MEAISYGLSQGSLKLMITELPERESASQEKLLDLATSALDSRGSKRDRIDRPLIDYGWTILKGVRLDVHSLTAPIAPAW